MFTIYYSNNIDILLNLIKIQIIKKPLINPLESEIILCNNVSFTKLIKINFSNILGIYGNFNFFSFDKFIWNLFKKIIPNIGKDDFLCKENIIWKIALIFPKLIYTQEFYYFKKNFYYKIKDFNYLFNLSIQIANLYDKYQKYKPEWLLLWEYNKFFLLLKDKHQIWQAKLWKELLIYYKNKLNKTLWNYGKLYKFYNKNKKNNNFKYNFLPERIFILDIQNIPLIYLKLLKEIEKYIEIHILIYSPSKYYWENLSNYKYDENININNENYIYNKLLLSWGNYHLNNVNKLINLPARIIETFIKNNTINLLNNIKNNILYSSEHNINIKNNQKKEISYLDKSIQIYICEDIYTEVKLLYNDILYTLRNNKNYFLHDIIIISPNLGLYIPFIDSVFKNCNLPINIGSNSNKLENLDVLKKILFLLNLPYKKFTPEEIFFLLEDKYISKKFFLNKEDLEYLNYWVKKLGIKHGLNFKNFNKIIFNKDQYTWKLGLHRMFLNYAFNFERWNNIIPYNGSIGLSKDLLGKFTNFLFKLEKWKNKLNKKYFLKEWQKIILKLYSDFFPYSTYLYNNIYYIIKKIIFFLENGLVSKYEEKISIDIIIEKVKYQIKKENKNFFFHINKINFCPFHIFQNISFKKIFMIGMNNEYFPKKSYPIIFDLMKNYPYKEEKNYLDEDKNIFLKLIMSAEKKLYISYFNNKKINNIQNISSSIISELLIYIFNNYYIKNNKINNHIIKYIYKNKFNFLLKKKEENNTYNKNINILKSIKITKIKINNLINFWKHPVKGFFNQRFKIYLQDLNKIKLLNTEPFNIDYLQEYIINKKILYSLILNKNINNLYNYYLNQNILPYGYYGKIWWEERVNKMKKIFNNYFKKNQYTEIINKIDLKILNINLKGQIKYLNYNNNLIKFEPKIIDIKSIISLWIEHLILCVNNIYVNSSLLLFGSKNTKYIFKLLSKDEAYVLLKKYIKGYISGINSPIMLPIRSSWKWINICYNKKKNIIDNNYNIQNKAKKIFFYYWNKNDYFIGESKDLYFNRLNFNLDKKEWIKIKKLIQKWMFNLIYYAN
ncbi:exodeoxyribonuclease V subunit gamma [Enterobacteriaceae endosymbiont of Donacia semicuprea]|uniref:exodeoxyribonuclease V subunit gamma n=1 Tax=Enterobacteriaceae endosymbiont of Donacia semicuprea TaxID=2675783 RepID=UPI001448DB65|nr:exodeoxyribonuclease V subunit gamma [Enterobacteriaceae endosymbiont of Donacia semicuprea]QJC33051.1 hypothetical protein GJT91_02040 [Enterobacteriaceae endosymbiont of Donacia semicuprea]